MERCHKSWRGIQKFQSHTPRPQGQFKSFLAFIINHHTQMLHCSIFHFQGQRIHAFVPTKAAAELQHQVIVGRVFSFKNYIVQSYIQSDRFRVLRNDRQLVFGQETLLQELADDGVTIPQDAFDFYDHSQLLELSKQTTYLAGNYLTYGTIISIFALS